jgi:hypothetical protein
MNGSWINFLKSVSELKTVDAGEFLEVALKESHITFFPPLLLQL